MAVTYRVIVEGAVVDEGTVPCSTGITYANTALSRVEGAHAVRLDVGDEVRGTRMAWARLLPAGDV